MQEIFNKNLKDIKKSQSVMNNATTGIKNTLEGTSSRVTEAEERISDLEIRMVDITAMEQNKEGKEMKTL